MAPTQTSPPNTYLSNLLDNQPLYCVFQFIPTALCFYATRLCAHKFLFSLPSEIKM